MNRATKIAIGGAVAAGATAALLVARERRSDAPASYPPLDVPKPFADDIWIVDSGPLVAGGLSLPIRMTVIRLENGDLLLHSPTAWTPALGAALEQLGTVRHLIAPNVAHWMMVEGWQRAYPAATVWAAPGLRERPAVQRSGLRIDRILGGGAPTEWSAEITQGVIRGGAGFRETWFWHRASRTLVLTDVVQNMDPAILPPLTATVARASGGAAGTTPRYIRPILRMGGEDTRRTLAALVALSPERVIFAHGESFTHDASARLRDALGWIGLPEHD